MLAVKSMKIFRVYFTSFASSTAWEIFVTVLEFHTNFRRNKRTVRTILQKKSKSFKPSYSSIQVSKRSFRLNPSSFSVNFSSVLLAGAALLAPLAGLARLLWQQHRLDVGQDAALGDGHAGQQLVQLLVIPDGQLQVAGDDAGLLVVPGGVAGQLQHLGGQVLHDGGQVDGCAGAHALGVVALAEEAVDAAHGELEAGAGRARLGLAAALKVSTTS